VVYSFLTLTIVFEPRVLQSLRASQALLRINYQQLLDQVLALIRYVIEFFVLEVEFAFFYFLKNNIGIFPLEWQIPRNQCVKDYSNRPEISLHVVVTC